MTDIVLPQLAVEVRRSWSDPWKPVPFLEVGRFDATVNPSIPTAYFIWNYGEIDDGSGTFWPYPRILDGYQGWFCRICQRRRTPARIESVGVWYGVICHDQDDQAAANWRVAGPSGDQVPSARGLEILLERAAIDGSVVNIEGEAVLIDTPIPFNVIGRRGRASCGNRSALRFTNPATGLESYVFHSPGELWTAKDMLEYALAWFCPPAVMFHLAGQTGNLEHSTPSVAAPANVRALLNRLVDRRRGHAWTVTVEGEQATVRVGSVFDRPVHSHGLAIEAADQVISIDGDADSVEEVRATRSSDHQIDRIIARGGPIIVCGTVRFSDGTLAKAWSQQQENEYVAASETARMAEGFSSVFRAFRVPTAVLGLDSLRGPSCGDDGKLNWSQPAAQYWKAKTLLRHLPLPVAAENAEDPPDEFRPPLIAAILTVDEQDYRVQVDKIGKFAQGLGTSGPSFSVTMLDGEMGFRLHAEPNYLLALNHYDGAEGDVHEPFIDYQTIIATVAWASDAHLQVVEDLPAAQNPDCPRTLVIHVPQAVAWVVLEGTMTDVEDGGLTVMADPLELRNDREHLAAVAALARAWYQRDRRAVTVRWGTLVFDYPAGALVDTVLSSAGSVPVGSMITEVSWDAAAGRTELRTDFRELDFAPAAGLEGGGAGLETPSLGDPNFADCQVNLPVRLAAPDTSIGGFFPVKVTKTSGSEGSRTTQCTFVYTVKTLGGSVLGTGLTPGRPRPPRGRMVAPAADSCGVAFYDMGELRLWDAGEVHLPEY